MPERTYEPSFVEICTKVNNAKDKPAKIKVLREYRSESLEMFLKGALDPNMEWLLPAGDVPYMPNEAPEGTEHTTLHQEIHNCHNFVKLHRDFINMSPVYGNPILNQPRREMMFIQMLEGLHTTEADLLILAKDKKLSKKYKGLTANCVQEAFGWDAHFQPLPQPDPRLGLGQIERARV